MTWDVAEPLMEAGRLPNLARLVQAGVGGDLRSYTPTFSPVLWTSIATGVPPLDHGILYFSEVNEQNVPKPDGLPYTSNCRKVPAIWNMAGAAGRTVNSVAWWVSWPAEPIPGSRIVASYAAQAQGRVLWKPLVWEDGIPALTYPEDLQQQIAPHLEAGAPGGPLVGEYNQVFGTVPPEWRFAYELDRFFRGVYHADATHQRIFLDLIRDGGLADLNMVYFGLADVAGHYFWRYREPDFYRYSTPAEQVERLQHHIDLAYEQVDRWIGEIAAALPPEATILLVSDHGMGPVNADLPNSKQSGGHYDPVPGVVVLSGREVQDVGLRPADQRQLAALYDITPTLLELMELPQGSYMQGKPMTGFMTPEWTADHPTLTPRDWLDGFREATPPLIPGEGMDEAFFSFLDEIGYTDSGSDR